MGKMLFDRDPLSGIVEYFYYDEKEDTFTIETVQNVEALLEGNKRSFNDHDGGWKGDMHHVASIPLNIYEDLRQRGILRDQKRLRAWLNDPNNRYFRTRPGRV